MNPQQQELDRKVDGKPRWITSPLIVVAVAIASCVLACFPANLIMIISLDPLIAPSDPNWAEGLGLIQGMAFWIVGVPGMVILGLLIGLLWASIERNRQELDRRAPFVLGVVIGVGVALLLAFGAGYIAMGRG